MYQSKKIVCVIPARLASSRFPQKVLASLAGKPLLQWVYEAACQCPQFDEILFAVDAYETKALIEGFGAKVLMTPQECLNGTERMIAVKKLYSVQADVWVNWQADEPFIHQDIIQDLLQSIEDTSDVWTLRKHITTEEEYLDPNVVKVVVNARSEALYFSRYPIPYHRDKEIKRQNATELKSYSYKHIGLYAFTDKALETIHGLSKCQLEEVEALEQLRFLYYGMRIRVHETIHQTLGIDLPEHMVLAEQQIKTKLLLSC